MSDSEDTEKNHPSKRQFVHTKTECHVSECSIHEQHCL